MNNQKKKPTLPSSDAVLGQPENTTELLNKYGTYEIQPTSDSDNEFPAISQGLAENKAMRPKTEKPPHSGDDPHYWARNNKGGQKPCD